ncbi:hypothetical protein FA95DRAFT_225265 [Auriscalpium vulgare]|uniref:Uncharacterized protein n=1 Tax=Auriscalpium vulgare TaxID=40419 RepID=A0ACB8RKC5_9AGAM|nr:hypothetical protein FA95DRAFT_225265 [Auriscalpium vulgare]
MAILASTASAASNVLVRSPRSRPQDTWARTKGVAAQRPGWSQIYPSPREVRGYALAQQATCLKTAVLDGEISLYVDAEDWNMAGRSVKARAIACASGGPAFSRLICGKPYASLATTTSTELLDIRTIVAACVWGITVCGTPAFKTPLGENDGMEMSLPRTSTRRRFVSVRKPSQLVGGERPRPVAR